MDEYSRNSLLYPRSDIVRLNLLVAVLTMKTLILSRHLKLLRNYYLLRRFLQFSDSVISSFKESEIPERSVTMSHLFLSGHLTLDLLANYL